MLGTNVDYASTWLAMAGLASPPTYDGRSILAQLVPAENEGQLPAPTRARVQADREALADKPWRTEQFFQYYNQGRLCSLITGFAKIVLPRFGEFCYFCCVLLLPQLSWSILATWKALFW